MKLLFIDHNCHQRTHSVDFILQILRNAFDVTEHWYDHHYKTHAGESMRGQDVAVIVEFPISRNRFFFPGKRNIFVPMYDNEWGSFWQWKRIAWSGMGVISFCKKVSDHARHCGVKNLLDVRYFLDPASFPNLPGDSKKIFLWERGGVTRQMVETMFPPSEGYTFIVKGAHDFWPREDYLQKIASCGIVIAPRLKEGIGMAFLEAMAMGKCVVANNDATMNEYITDGETGILFDPQNLKKCDFATIEKIRANLAKTCAVCYARWQHDAAKINDFITSQPVCRPSFVTRFKIALAYPLFVTEGLVHRLGEVL